MKKIILFLILLLAVSILGCKKSKLPPAVPLPDSDDITNPPDPTPIEQGYFKYTKLPQDITQLCPERSNGDCDFKGNGPEVWANVWANMTLDRKEIVLTIYFKLKEKHRNKGIPDDLSKLKDTSTAYRTWTKRIYRAPEQYEIVYFSGTHDSYLHFTNTTDNLEYNEREPDSGDLVRLFTIKADTGGGDICTCLRDEDSEMDLSFNSIDIYLRKTSK